MEPVTVPLPALMFYGMGGVGKSWLLRKLQLQEFGLTAGSPEQYPVDRAGLAGERAVDAGSEVSLKPRESVPTPPVSSVAGRS